MNRISSSFSDNRKKLITFLVAGDPDLETSFRSFMAMIENGADMIEIGIPFSDPIAEGPVIQEANERALKNNFKIHDAFELVRKIRAVSDIPVLFLTYFNIIYRYGIESFLKKCKDTMIDGLIIPDLPYEEHHEIKVFSSFYGINIISLISSISGDRAAMIAKYAEDYIYCVSSLGVTGERDIFTDDIFDLSKVLDQATNKKKAVGFGISSTEQVKCFKEYFDGVIIGSAFVKLCKGSDIKNIPIKIGSLTRRFKDVL